MQETYPQTPEGLKTYALSGWVDWGVWPFVSVPAFTAGNMDAPYGTIYHRETGKIQNFYVADEFWEGMRLHSKAYNMGILDPDIFVNNFDAYYEKVKAGQILTLHASWWVSDINNFFMVNGSPEMGFEPIPNVYGKFNDLYADLLPLGWQGSYAHGITKNCENPEKAMEFINFCYTDEGAKLIYRGIEGEDWETVDGKPRYTQAYLDGKASDENFTKKRGFTYQRLVGPDVTQIASDGYPYDIAASNDAMAELATPIDLKFAQHYGDFRFPGEAVEAMVKQGKLQAYDFKYHLAPSLVKEPTQETQSTLMQVEEYFKANVAKIVMAKDDAEFEAIKQQILDDIMAKGYDKALAEMEQLYREAEDHAKTFDLEQ